MTENGLVPATIGVSTNVRPDHVEVFGTDTRSVLSASAFTIPRNKIPFTAEQ